MTDRPIIYTGALPQTVDVLNAGKFAMFGDAFLAMSTLGNSGSSPSTVVAGLACTPTGPASLQVIVGPGAIFAVDPADATAYGVLGTDPTNIYKMGIRASAGNFTITPPGTVGFSQVFLVQAILSDVDTGGTVLSYYNSANPAIPLSGPANSGTSQNTKRTCVCTVALKAGVAATTGTQTTPAPDAGYIALYAITVANGAATITSGNIAQITTTRWVWASLPDMPLNIQQGSWVAAVDTGTNSALVINPVPPLPAYVFGCAFHIKTANAPTGATTVNVNGLGNKSVVNADGSAIQANQWIAGAFVSLRYDGTNFQLTNATKTAGVTIPLQNNTTFYVNSGTGSDSYDGTSATHTTGSVGPWATLQHAMDVITQYNLNGFSITINVANGTYSAGLTLKNMSGSGFVNWVGNSVTPSSVNCQTTNRTSLIGSDCGKAHTFNGFKWGATTGGSPTDEMAGVIMSGLAQVTLTNCDWGPCADAMVKAVAGARIRLDGTIRLAGNALAFAETILNGIIDSVNVGPPTISAVIVGTITFSTAFAYSVQGGQMGFVYSTSTNFAGVTGKRYQADLNGVINTSGGGANYYPGTVAGTTSNGGQYA